MSINCLMQFPKLRQKSYAQKKKGALRSSTTQKLVFGAKRGGTPPVIVPAKS